MRDRRVATQDVGRRPDPGGLLVGERQRVVEGREQLDPRKNRPHQSGRCVRLAKRVCHLVDHHDAGDNARCQALRAVPGIGSKTETVQQSVHA